MSTFLSLNQFLCCHHSLESSRREDSNEWSQHRIPIRLEEILQKMLTVPIIFSSLHAGYFFKYLFLSKDAKNQCFLPKILLKFNMNVKQFGSRWSPTKCGASSEIQIIWHSDYISAKKMGGNNEFLKLLKETNIWKNYPACKELIEMILSWW